MMPRYSIISVLVALGIGVVTACALAPSLRVDRALTQIVHHEAEVRQDGWARLLQEQHAETHLRSINERLLAAEDAALLDGAEQLRRVELWDWSTQPADLVLREATLRAEGTIADKETALLQMSTSPLDLDERSVMNIFWHILNDAEGPLLRRGMETALGWIGPHRYQIVRRLPLFDDENTRRVLRLAVYWAHGRSVRPVLPRAWAQFDADAAMAQLERSFLDSDGMVYAAALLAEHSLQREDAVELAAKWLVDFNNDRKRCGALLAALLGEHADLLHEALDVATDPLVRTTFRLALLALGRPVGDGGDIEFAFRTLHLPDGHVNPDTLFCLLVAGYNDAPRYLASTPSVTAGEALRARTLLIERFIPYWNIHAAVDAGSTDPVTAYYEAMQAVWMLTHRWIEFDAATRTWQEHPAPQRHSSPPATE